MSATARLSRAPLPTAVVWGYLVVVVVFCAAYLATGSEVVYTVGSMTGVVAIVVGMHRNRPARPEVWRLFAVVPIVSAVGAVVRELTAAPGTELSLPGDAIGLLVYALSFAWLLGLVRAAGGGAREGSLEDGLLVAIGSMVVLWVLLISPTLTTPVPLVFRVTSSIFPVLDMLVLFLLARLAFARPQRIPSLALLFTNFALVLVGDLLGALELAGYRTSSLLIWGSYLAALGLSGAAVLHPSVRILTEPSPTVVRPLSRVRLLTVTVGFAAPALLVLLRPIATPTDRAAVGVGILLLAGVAHLRTVRAVNQYAASEQRLAHLATHDSLTGLPNRVLLRERIASELQTVATRRGEVVAVLFVDLDGFKRVNDTWGHSIGDELLTAVGERLSAKIDRGETVARVGGDEFVLVCTSADPDAELPAVADRLLRVLADPFPLSVGEVYIGASIGIAHSGVADAGATPDELVRDADVAMYQAKGEGRNRWLLFAPAMRQVVAQRLDTERAVRLALERDELVVHYQPVVRLDDGVPISLEALVRWQRPGRGLVPPGAFIPVIEDSDLILPVGALVLRRAARQLAFWRASMREAAELRVSVNVTARQLRDPDFLGLVRSVLAETGLPGSALTLEITETTMVEDSEVMLARFRGLRALGVRLSVDDFGIGYSSLRYLKTFPVTQVKIDRAFVDGLGDDADDEAIVAAVLAMAHALGLDVVAEGVETELQRDHLRALGCDAAQGFLYARPLPADVVTPLLAAVPSKVAT